MTVSEAALAELGARVARLEQIVSQLQTVRLPERQPDLRPKESDCWPNCGQQDLSPNQGPTCEHGLRPGDACRRKKNGGFARTWMLCNWILLCPKSSLRVGAK